MTLRERLDTLRRQSGAPVAPGLPASRPAGPGGLSTGSARSLWNERPDLAALVERLRRIQGAGAGAGVLSRPGEEAAPRPAAAERIERLAGAGLRSAPAPGVRERALPGSGWGRIAPAAPADAGRLAELLGGEILTSGVILTERRLPLSTSHGNVRLRRAAGRIRGLPEGEVDARDCIFLDTETTGLSGGTGTVVFLLGAARVLDDELVVRQYTLTAFAGEGALLAACAEWAEGTSAVVTFNGKAFDLPLVASRCRLSGVADRFSRLEHLDLLHVTRRAFATRWENCRLSTAERRLLRFEREGDLPGSEAPASWFAFIRRGDAGLLPLVAEHNYWDVVSLAALLPRLAEVHVQPGAWEADILAVARAHRRSGNGEFALALLDEHRSMLGPAGLLELASHHRRAKRWDEAVAIWEVLSARGHPEAVERLAMYHEHVRRDFGTALAVAERLPRSARHERRRARLRRKLAKRRGAAAGRRTVLAAPVRP